MFHKFLLILLVCFIAFGFTGTPDKIQFMDASLKKVVKKAKNDNKLVFIFVGSEHCDLCLRTKETFQNKEVAELYNAKYVNLKLNPDKVYNNMRLTNWGVSQIPYLIFMIRTNVLSIKLVDSRPISPCSNTGERHSTLCSL